MLALVTAIGRLALGVTVPWDHAPAMLVTLVDRRRLLLLPRYRPDALIPSEDAAPRR